MKSPEEDLRKARIISRIYELVHSMTEEQQLLLLRHVVGEDMAHHIFKAILDMPEPQQLQVMNQMEEMIGGNNLWDEEKGNIVDIDTRQGSRKPCVIRVDFSTEGHSAQELISDISIGGAFIRTDQPLVMGQQVALSFAIPNFEKSFDISGQVVRCDDQGIGVKFDSLTDKQQELMMSLIESMDKK